MKKETRNTINIIIFKMEMFLFIIIGIGGAACFFIYKVCKGDSFWLLTLPIISIFIIRSYIKAYRRLRHKIKHHD